MSSLFERLSGGPGFSYSPFDEDEEERRRRELAAQQPKGGNSLLQRLSRPNPGADPSQLATEEEDPEFDRIRQQYAEEDRRSPFGEMTEAEKAAKFQELRGLGFVPTRETSKRIDISEFPYIPQDQSLWEGRTREELARLNEQFRMAAETDVANEGSEMRRIVDQRTLDMQAEQRGQLPEGTAQVAFGKEMARHNDTMPGVSDQYRQRLADAQEALRIYKQQEVEVAAGERFSPPDPLSKEDMELLDAAGIALPGEAARVFAKSAVTAIPQIGLATQTILTGGRNVDEISSDIAQTLENSGVVGAVEGLDEHRKAREENAGTGSAIADAATFGLFGYDKKTFGERDEVVQRNQLAATMGQIVGGLPLGLINAQNVGTGSLAQRMTQNAIQNALEQLPLDIVEAANLGDEGALEMAKSLVTRQLMAAGAGAAFTGLGAVRGTDVDGRGMGDVGTRLDLESNRLPVELGGPERLPVRLLDDPNEHTNRVARAQVENEIAERARLDAEQTARQNAELTERVRQDQSDIGGAENPVATLFKNQEPPSGRTETPDTPPAPRVEEVFNVSEEAVRTAAQQGDTIVTVRVEDLFEAAKEDIQRTGRRSLDKLDGVREFLAAGNKVDVPTLSIQNGRVIIDDGFHRTRVAQEMGLEAVPVRIERGQAGQLRDALTRVNELRQQGMTRIEDMPGRVGGGGEGEQGMVQIGGKSNRPPLRDRLQSAIRDVFEPDTGKPSRVLDDGTVVPILSESTSQTRGILGAIRNFFSEDHRIIRKMKGGKSGKAGDEAVEMFFDAQRKGRNLGGTLIAELRDAVGIRARRFTGLFRRGGFGGMLNNKSDFSVEEVKNFGEVLEGKATPLNERVASRARRVRELLDLVNELAKEAGLQTERIENYLPRVSKIRETPEMRFQRAFEEEFDRVLFDNLKSQLAKKGITISEEQALRQPTSSMERAFLGAEENIRTAEMDMLNPLAGKKLVGFETDVDVANQKGMVIKELEIDGRVVNVGVTDAAIARAREVAEAKLEKRAGEISGRKFGPLEKGRVLEEKGAQFIEDPITALEMYFRGAAQRIAEAKGLGVDAERLKGKVNKIANVKDRTFAIAKFAEAMGAPRRGTRGEAISQIARNLLASVDLVHVALSNLPQIGNTAIRTGTYRTFKNMAKFFADKPKAVDQALRDGVIMEQIMGEPREMWQLGGSGSFLSGRTPGRGLDALTDRLIEWGLDKSSAVARTSVAGAYQLNRMEAYLRTVTDMSARDLVDTSVKIIQNPKKAHKLGEYFGISSEQQARRALRDAGLDPEALMTRKPTEAEYALAAQKIVEETQFLGGGLREPGATQGPVKKLIFQYKNFALKQSQFIIDNIKGAIQANEHGERAGSVFLRAAPAAGSFAAGLASSFFPDDPDSNTKELMQIAGFMSGGLNLPTSLLTELVIDLKAWGTGRIRPGDYNIYQTIENVTTGKQTIEEAKRELRSVTIPEWKERLADDWLEGQGGFGIYNEGLAVFGADDRNRRGVHERIARTIFGPAINKGLDLAQATFRSFEDASPDSLEKTEDFRRITETNPTMPYVERLDWANEARQSRALTSTFLRSLGPVGSSLAKENFNVSPPQREPLYSRLADYALSGGEPESTATRDLFARPGFGPNVSPDPNREENRAVLNESLEYREILRDLKENKLSQEELQGLRDMLPQFADTEAQLRYNNYGDLPKSGPQKRRIDNQRKLERAVIERLYAQAQLERNTSEMSSLFSFYTDKYRKLGTFEQLMENVDKLIELGVLE